MVNMWIIVFLVLLFIELITVNLVSIWFAIGALAAYITTFFTDNITIQIIVFIVVSIIALLVTKPFMKKIRVRKVEPTNLDRVIGKEGVVTKDISKNAFGEVNVKGSIWTATAKEEITKGTQVKVLKIDGVKLLVEEIKEEK